MILKKFLTTCWLIVAFWSSLSAQSRPLTLPSKFQTDILFIQQAESATLKQNQAKPDSYLLTLRGLNPRIIYFTTESKHLAGMIQLKEFLKVWRNNQEQFGDEGPTGIINYQNFNPTNQNGVETDAFELTNPIYDRPSNSITYTATPSHNQPVKVGRFKNIVVIYDGLSMPVDKFKSEYKVMENTTAFPNY